MKLTEKQKEELKSVWGDWEVYHSHYDDLIYNRLKELDPEFIEDLHKESEGATFWYA